MSDLSSEPGVDGRDNPDEHISEDEEGGLFGSGSDDDGLSEAATAEAKRRKKKRREEDKKKRKLDDSELDSGDDEDRSDRIKETVEDDDPILERTATVMEIGIGTHPGPLPSDGELYLLQLPYNITISPKAFTLDGFEPQNVDVDPASAYPSFSAFAASNNTIRWRKSPSDPIVVQSNARINRWSDGSLTLQVGSNAREQFQLTAKPLANPQINPAKPTPTSINATRGPAVAYGQRSDTHTYLASPHEMAGFMRNSHQITTSLAVHSTEQDDDALIRLQEGMAAAVRGNKATADGGVEVISINEDPENAKRRAELAEKEKAKMQRRYQNQQDRESNRANNVLKRSGLRTGGLSTGLTVGGLEGDDGVGTKLRKSKPKSKSRRRMDEYSDEDDYSGRRRTKEDEYDEDDGFLVPSDEEPEVAEDSEEEGDDVDLDAEGEDDEQIPEPTAAPVRESEDAGGAGGRHKRRRVIDDEDEE